MKNNTFLLVAAMAVGGFLVYKMVSKEDVVSAQTYIAGPTVSGEPTYIAIPSGAPGYALAPEPTPEPATEPTPEPEYEWTEAESQSIAANFLGNYFNTVDPGAHPGDWICSMSHVRTDTLRTPYGWDFTYQYMCVHPAGGTSYWNRSVPVIRGVLGEVH